MLFMFPVLWSQRQYAGPARKSSTTTCGLDLTHMTNPKTTKLLFFVVFGFFAISLPALHAGSLSQNPCAQAQQQQRERQHERDTRAVAGLASVREAAWRRRGRLGRPDFG